MTPVVEPLLAAKDYTAALSKLAALRAPIDAFFDGVMVMADDADLKNRKPFTFIGSVTSLVYCCARHTKTMISADH
ncbi:hypothetical protein AB3515_07035 [Acinetobacter baumannii]